MSELAATETPIAANPIDAVMQYATSGNAVDMDVMRELMTMRRDMQAEAAKVAYNEAMARAQAGMPVIKRDRTNTHTRATYATYEQITKQIRPVYTAEGLSLSFDSERAEEGYTRYICEVKHQAGHSERVSMELPPDDGGMNGKSNKNPVQALGSSMTYAKRYLTMEVFALAQSDDPDDDDGNAAAKAAPHSGYLLERIALYRTHFDFIADIKRCAEAEDAEAMAATLEDQAATDRMRKLGNEATLESIWGAPSKGGILETEEMKCIKSNEVAEARKNG